MCDTQGPVANRSALRLLGMRIRIRCSYVPLGFISILQGCFPSSFSRQSPWGFLTPWRSPFPSFIQNVGIQLPCSAYVSVAVPALGPSGGRTEREQKATGVHPTLLVPQLHRLDRKNPTLRILAPVCP